MRCFWPAIICGAFSNSFSSTIRLADKKALIRSSGIAGIAVLIDSERILGDSFTVINWPLLLDEEPDVFEEEL